MFRLVGAFVRPSAGRVVENKNGSKFGRRLFANAVTDCADGDRVYSAFTSKAFSADVELQGAGPR